MLKYGFVLIVLVSVPLGGCGKSAKSLSLEQRCILVLKRALTDEKATVVNHAGEALILAGRPEGLEEIFVALLERKEPDRAKRDVQTVVAARALCRLGRKKYISRVMEILNDPTSPRRHTAAETLGKLKYCKANDRIRMAIADKKYRNRSSMWAYGMGALAKCGDREAIVEMLKKGFASEEWNVRRITANDLSSIRLPAALVHIKKMAREEKHEMTRVDAAGALLQYEDFSGLEVLKKGMKSPKAGIRKHAVRVFKPVSNKAYIELLKLFIEDPDPDTRVMAAEVILHILRNAANRK